ncbi:MAG: hypothetical protein ACJ76Y_02170 [Thermoanaerobaculia bacterium]
MNDLLEVFKHASPVLLVTVVAAYFLKVFLEKRMEGFAGRAERQLERVASRVEEIAKTSLEVKKELRSAERGELVAFRVAVEEWENFLQTLLFDFSMGPPSKAKIEPLSQKDNYLFLKVKIAVVKAGIYLRDKQLEQQLMAAVINLRKTYYPIINEPLPRLIDLQSRLLPIERKLAAFEQSALSDISVAPTDKDREEHAALEAQLTKEMRCFSENLVREYRGIAEQLVALKEGINQYIYRPIREVAIDKD